MLDIRKFRMSDVYKRQLYGLWPSEEVDKSKISLKPVMSLHSRVASVSYTPLDVYKRQNLFTL